MSWIWPKRQAGWSSSKFLKSSTQVLLTTKFKSFYSRDMWYLDYSKHPLGRPVEHMLSRIKVCASCCEISLRANETCPAAPNPADNAAC